MVGHRIILARLRTSHDKSHLATLLKTPCLDVGVKFFVVGPGRRSAVIGDHGNVSSWPLILLIHVP